MRSRFSQKTNFLLFNSSLQKNKTNSLVCFWENLWRANLLTVLSDLYPKCKTSERLRPQCVLYRCCHHCDFYDRYCCFCCRIFYCKFNTFLWKKTKQKDFYHQFRLKNVEFSSYFLDPPPIPKCSLILKNL